MKAESRPPFVASAIPPTARMQSHGAERLFWCGRQKSPFLAPQKTQKSQPYDHFGFSILDWDLRPIQNRLGSRKTIQPVAVEFGSDCCAAG